MPQSRGMRCVFYGDSWRPTSVHISCGILLSPYSPSGANIRKLPYLDCQTHGFSLGIPKSLVGKMAQSEIQCKFIHLMYEIAQNTVNFFKINLTFSFFISFKGKLKPVSLRSLMILMQENTGHTQIALKESRCVCQLPVVEVIPPPIRKCTDPN